MKVAQLAAAIGLLVTAIPAYAQETGTLVTHRAAQIDGRGRDAARLTMERFMTCAVSRQSGRARNLSRLAIDLPEYERGFVSLYDTMGDICLGSDGELRFTEGLFRGGLFQALYARDFGTNGPTDFSGVTSSGYPQLYSSPLSDRARAALALEQFGECVSRADANGVRDLLRQLPGSAGEREAITALRSHFAACIPQNETIQFSPSVLKGALAEGIYRLSVAARGETRIAEAAQ